MYFLATPVFAQDAAAPQSGGGGWQLIIMMAVIFVIFYVLTVLPQRKKEKAHKAMLESLKKGDKVLTIGGIYGVVHEINSEKGIVTLNVGDKTKMEFTRSSIQGKVS